LTEENVLSYIDFMLKKPCNITVLLLLIIMITVMSTSLYSQGDSGLLKGLNEMSRDREVTVKKTVPAQDKAPNVKKRRKSLSQNSSIGKKASVDTEPPVTIDTLTEEGSEGEEAPKEPRQRFITILMQGGPVMIVIIFLQLVSLTIIIERFLYFTFKGYWGSRKVVRLLLQRAEKLPNLSREEIEDELNSLYGTIAARLEMGLPLLAGIGSVAPIVGFLGTVLGMIDAFSSIASASTVNAKVVASGIQVALITTAGGLVVAAPALIVYYFLSHILQGQGAEVDNTIVSISSRRKRLTEEGENSDEDERQVVYI
jgi:biopolymer transport protein ExbB